MADLRECPYCGLEFEENCEYVGVGVGFAQVTPNRCERCCASEIGGYDRSKARPHEIQCGWFEPTSGDPDHARIADLVENAFAMGVRHMTRLGATLPGNSPSDSLSPALSVSSSPRKQP
jgi:hypothetical protein